MIALLALRPLRLAKLARLELDCIGFLLVLEHEGGQANAAISHVMELLLLPDHGQTKHQEPSYRLFGCR